MFTPLVTSCDIYESILCTLKPTMGPAVCAVLWKEGGGSRRGPSGRTAYKIENTALLCKSRCFMRGKFLLLLCWRTPVPRRATCKTKGLKCKGGRAGSGNKLRVG